MGFPPHPPVHLRRARLLRPLLRSLQLIYPQSHPRTHQPSLPHPPQRRSPRTPPQTHPRGNPPQGPPPYRPTGTMLCVDRKISVMKTTSWLTTIPSTRSAAVRTRVSRDGRRETTARSGPSPCSTRHATRSRRIVRHGTSALAPPLVRVSVPRWSLKTSAQGRLAAVLTRNWYGRALKGLFPTNHPLHPVIRHWRPVDPLFPPHLPMHVQRARLLRQPLRTLQLTPLPIPPRSPLLIPSQVSPRSPQLIYPQSHPRTHQPNLPHPPQRRSPRTPPQTPPRGNPPQGPPPYRPTGTMLCVERKMV